MLNLKANSAASASGVVVEARVERGVGTVMTMLVQRGTLKLGDSFIAGEAFGKVKPELTPLYPLSSRAYFPTRFATHPPGGCVSLFGGRRCAL